MSEKETSVELEAFKAEYIGGLENVLAFLEMDPATHFGLDFESLGLDSQITKLASGNPDLIRQLIADTLEADLDQQIGSYHYQIPENFEHPGVVQATVHSTASEEVFLHQLTFADGVVTFSLGPNEPSISFDK